jgi:hypothetical protein
VWPRFQWGCACWCRFCRLRSLATTGSLVCVLLSKTKPLPVTPITPAFAVYFLDDISLGHVGWAALLTRTAQDQLSTGSCIVLLALHAGTSGRGQGRTTLLDPSYLVKRAHTSTVDGDRAGAGRAPATRSPPAVPPPSPRAPPSRTPAACTPSRTTRWRRARASGESWCRLAASAPWLPKQDAGRVPRARARVRGHRGAGRLAKAARPLASRAQFTGINWG